MIRRHIACLIFVFAVFACDSSAPTAATPEPPETTDPPDTDPPAVTILTDSAEPDPDGDGLIELELKWTNGDVDVASVGVRSLDGLSGEPGTANLLDEWFTARLDDSGLTLREQVDALLPAGASRIELTAADSVGNVWSDTLVVTLPALALNRDIVLGVGPHHPTFCDGRLFVALQGYVIVVFDGASLRELGRLTDAFVTDLACATGQSRLVFAGIRPGVVNTETLAIQQSDDAPTASAVTWDAADPSHFGVGTFEGAIRRYSVDDAALIDSVRLGGIGQIRGLVATGQTTVIAEQYQLAAFESGTDARVGRLRLPGGDFAPLAIAADPGRGHVYAGAVAGGTPLGVAAFDAADTVASGLLETGGQPATALAVSPDGKRLMVVTEPVPGYSGGFDVLLSLPDGVAVDSIPRPDDLYFHHTGAAFDATGGLLVVTTKHDDAAAAGSLEVYIHRE